MAQQCSLRTNCGPTRHQGSDEIPAYEVRRRRRINVGFWETIDCDRITSMGAFLTPDEMTCRL
jgi:hypothetical protein